MNGGSHASPFLLSERFSLLIRMCLPGPIRLKMFYIPFEMLYGKTETHTVFLYKQMTSYTANILVRAVPATPEPDWQHGKSMAFLLLLR